MFHCQRRVSTAIKMLHTCTCNLHCEWPLLFPLLLSLRLLFSSLFLSIPPPSLPSFLPFSSPFLPLPSPHSTPFLPPILLPSFPHSSPSPLSLFPLSTPFSSFLVPLSSPPLSSPPLSSQLSPTSDGSDHSALCVCAGSSRCHSLPSEQAGLQTVRTRQSEPNLVR